MPTLYAFPLTQHFTLTEKLVTRLVSLNSCRGKRQTNMKYGQDKKIAYRNICRKMKIVKLDG